MLHGSPQMSVTIYLSRTQVCWEEDMVTKKSRLMHGYFEEIYEFKICFSNSIHYKLSSDYYGTILLPKSHSWL